MTAVNQYVIITSVSEWIYLISFKLSEILGFTNMALDHAQSYAAWSVNETQEFVFEQTTILLFC